MLKSYSNPILPWKQSFWTPQNPIAGSPVTTRPPRRTVLPHRRRRRPHRRILTSPGKVSVAPKKEREREKESRQISPNVIIWHPTSTKIHQTLVFNSETWQPGGLRSGWDVFFTRSDNLPKLCFSVLVAYVLNHVTLWLCQNSYWKWPIEIVDLPIENGDFP